MIKIYALTKASKKHSNAGELLIKKELLASFTYALEAGRYADERQRRNPIETIRIVEGKRSWHRGPLCEEMASVVLRNGGFIKEELRIS